MTSPWSSATWGPDRKKGVQILGGQGPLLIHAEPGGGAVYIPGESNGRFGIAHPVAACKQGYEDAGDITV